MLRIFALLLLFPIIGFTAPAPRPRTEVRPSMVGYWFVSFPWYYDTLLHLNKDGTSESWGLNSHHRKGTWKLNGDLLEITQRPIDNLVDGYESQCKVLLVPNKTKPASHYYSMEKR